MGLIGTVMLSFFLADHSCFLEIRELLKLGTSIDQMILFVLGVVKHPVFNIKAYPMPSSIDAKYNFLTLTVCVQSLAQQ